MTLFISNGGTALLSFVLAALVGRALGEEGLGVYAAALAWVFPLSIIAEFGLGTLITRDVAQNPASGPDYLRTVAALRLLVGLPLFGLTLLAAPLISNDPDVAAGLRISAPLIVIFPFFGAFTALFRAYQIMWPLPWLNIGMLAVQVSLTALAFVLDGGVRAALVINMVTSGGQVLAAWGIYRWKFMATSEAGALRETSLPTQSLIPLLRQAWPFAVAAFLGALQIRLGLIMLEQFADTAAVGLFAAATRFVDAGRLLPNALFGALFPALAALSTKPDRMRDTFDRALRGLVLFALVAAILATLLAAPVLRLVFGADFSAAAGPLRILMWALAPAVLRAARTLYWYALKREHYVNIVSAMVLALQFALSLWLIPRHGANGAASAMLIAEIFGVTLLWRAIRLTTWRAVRGEGRGTAA